MEVRPDIKFYSYAALSHPEIFKKVKEGNEKVIISQLTFNTLPNIGHLRNVVEPYSTQYIDEIFNEYFSITEDLTKNWDVYLAVEYDKYVRPDEVIFVGEKWETDLASKYFGDGMLETVE